jgi:hypothetical protein
VTANVQVSYRDNAGRIFVIGGENFDEFYANSVDLIGDTAARQLTEDFQLLVNPEAAPAVAAAGPVRANAAAPARAAAAPVPGAPTCEHGARTHRTGVGSKGPWSAWFCPQPKGAAQCEAIWG